MKFDKNRKNTGVVVVRCIRENCRGEGKHALGWLCNRHYSEEYDTRLREKLRIQNDI